ncbi:hypothetical protein MHTCC0001_31920 [Flavobacteriaceae bacterium MHTCC 0001]
MEIEISYDKEKIKRKFNHNVLLFLIGVMLTITGIVSNSTFLIAIGILLSIITGFYFFDFRKKSMPKLLLNDEGIVDRINWVCYGLIEWKDIKGFRTDKRFKNLILIDVENEKQYLEQLRVNRRFGPTYKKQLEHDEFGYGTVVFLDVTLLDEDRNTILKKIENFRSTLETINP